MSAESDDLELPELLQVLRTEHGVSLTYQRLWAAVMAGKVPAHRVGKRIRVNRTNVPAAAAALGMPQPIAA
jgi:hypothetical protein